MRTSRELKNCLDYERKSRPCFWDVHVARKKLSHLSDLFLKLRLGKSTAPMETCVTSDFKWNKIEVKFGDYRWPKMIISNEIFLCAYLVVSWCIGNISPANILLFAKRWIGSKGNLVLGRKNKQFSRMCKGSVKPFWDFKRAKLITMKIILKCCAETPPWYETRIIISNTE